jgi:hypothetical protein
VVVVVVVVVVAVVAAAAAVVVVLLLLTASYALTTPFVQSHTHTTRLSIRRAWHSYFHDRHSHGASVVDL